MSTSKIVKTTSSGITIKVVHRAGMIDMTTDGQKYGEELASYCESVSIIKDGMIIVTCGGGFNCISTTYPGMPSGAKAVVRGDDANGKPIAQPISLETYGVVTAAIKESVVEAEKEFGIDRDADLVDLNKKLDAEEAASKDYYDTVGKHICPKCHSVCWGDCSA